MNEILQQRIEEAANTTVQNLYDYARQARNPKVSAYSEGYLDAIDTQGEFLFKEGANYALSNQWISVEEALPEEVQEGCCDDKFVLYCGEYPATASYDHKRKKWYYGDYEILGVTHWMPIPPMKGDEK